MKNKKIRRFVAILATVMLVCGIALVLFPPISNWYGKSVALDISNEFDQSVDNQMDGSYSDAKRKGLVDDEGFLTDGSLDYPVYYKVDIERLRRDSIEYNEMLKTKQRDKLTNELAYEQPSLSLSEYGIFNGVYGYVEAPSIDMKLPIYLGTGRSHMEYGAAHLTFTSLPIGGKDTNCVLAGHTGYVGRIFFDNIRNLHIGDEIRVKNYWSTLKYTVTETKVISPKEMDDIFLKEGKDMVILMTCIKGDNGEFDRYLVFCERK